MTEGQRAAVKWMAQYQANNGIALDRKMEDILITTFIAGMVEQEVGQTPAK